MFFYFGFETSILSLNKYDNIYESQTPKKLRMDKHTMRDIIGHTKEISGRKN